MLKTYLFHNKNSFLVILIILVYVIFKICCIYIYVDYNYYIFIL